jgi:hypothetical protein
MVFCPRLRNLRPLGKYRADNNREEKKNNENDDVPETLRCEREQKKRTPTLSPGVFICCCQHGNCLGFMLMDQYETERYAFEILFTRFPHGTFS